ncbi:LysR family transcriptional regulator [Methanohalophilus portucalensis]|uniref:LysR family transcriptional regulator n=1 Tax=Methanohalophilus portucalensis FDF-1 TaxID=523843 RepID=A0A3M9LJD0_9EURY|nr:LysR family transcriptional regulator [Methanohalophilus portucalensis]RNI13369.1 LysR family transcriptional regulator [Methanohalophilus portucalensis FDF-1]
MIGAGKVRLLKAIDEEKSLKKACEKLHISYKHAWNILKKMNLRIGHDVVRTVRGGKEQGTFLTEYGRDLINQYELNRDYVDRMVEEELSSENVGEINNIPCKVSKVKSFDGISRIQIEFESAVLTSIMGEKDLEDLDIDEGDEVIATIRAVDIGISPAKNEGE